MVRALARILIYRPDKRTLDGLTITGYDTDEIDWKELVFRSKMERLVNRMAAEASRLSYHYRREDVYTQVIIEAPGIVVWEGEGEVKGVDTVFYPLMTRLDKVILYRREDEKLSPIKTIDVGREFYIYDGSIHVKADLEFDAIGFYTDKGLRIMFREELKLPVQTRIREKPKPKKVKKKKRTKTRKKTSKAKKKTRSRRKKRSKRKRK